MPSKLIAPIMRHCNGLILMIDPRIELLTIVQRLSGSEMVHNDGYGYSDEVDAWFMPFVDHPVVSKMKSLEERDFNNDAPVQYMLRYEGVPLVDRCFRYEEHVGVSQYARLEEIGNDVEFDSWIDLMNDFAEVSRFADFMLSQDAYYQKQLDMLTEKYSRSNVVEAITNWYGYRSGDFTFIFAPLIPLSGYGPCIVDSNGNQHNFCIMGNDDLITIIHEFSHSYVNPIVMQDIYRWNTTENLQTDKLLKRMYNAYNHWWVVVIEQFVRIAVIRILKRMDGDYNLESAIENEERCGFLYTRFLNGLCEEYEQSELAFNDYFPRFEEALEALAKDPDEYLASLKDYPMAGPINRALFDAWIIYPDPAENEGVTENILPVIEFISNRTGGTEITDTEAMERDLSTRHIIAFGPGNRWLDQYSDRLPFQMLPDRLIADRIYKGTNFRIVCCLPNPQNYEKGMVIYTGQSIHDMHSCNRFFHGPEDFVITDSECNILSNGNFIKDGDVWRF